MKRIICVLIIIFVMGFFFVCHAPEPVSISLAVPPPALKPIREAVPDVIMIAMRFVDHEGMNGFLLSDSASVKRQDREAYYISFFRSEPKNKRPDEFVVKVYKSNGRAEWSME
jgi:hypothetical protein